MEGGKPDEKVFTRGAVARRVGSGWLSAAGM
jgi:hypothetical protein